MSLALQKSRPQDRKRGAEQLGLGWAHPVLRLDQIHRLIKQTTEGNRACILGGGFCPCNRNDKGKGTVSNSEVGHQLSSATNLCTCFT